MGYLQDRGVDLRRGKRSLLWIFNEEFHSVMQFLIWTQLSLSKPSKVCM